MPSAGTYTCPWASNKYSLPKRAIGFLGKTLIRTPLSQLRVTSTCSTQDKELIFWGAPAIRSHPDNWYTIDWLKHFNNQLDFIPYARKAGYKGIIMTSWSTSGVYGYNWDTNYEVINMHPMRNVYPLSGFRILIAAYAQSLKQEEALNPQVFVSEYAQKRFGFSKEDGDKLWKILIASPQLIKNANEIDTIYQSVKNAKKIMSSLTPKYNKNEFKHLRLMIDLRLFYLNFKKIEAFYESDKYSPSTAYTIIPELEKLLKESKILDKRFSNLNKGFLYPNEIKEQNSVRSEKLIKIYEIVTKSK